MVITKKEGTLDLILPSGLSGEPIRRRLATIDYHSKPLQYTFSPEVHTPAVNRYLNQKVDVTYKIEDLVMAYIQGVQFVEELSDSIKKARPAKYFDTPRRAEYTTSQFQGVSEIPFAYVLPSAKNGVIKEEMGHYNSEKGIFLLTGYERMNIIKKAVIHELGHSLHHITETAAYFASDDIMLEVMAIFTEEIEKINIPNRYEKSPHKDAAELLRRLRKISSYNQMEPAQQWLYLSLFVNHTSLETDIFAVERKQTKPKKKQKCPCPRCSSLN